MRPTTDKARSSIFSILGENVKDARILDAFAGTGAFGIECYSRGSLEVVFIDKDTKGVEANINLISKGFNYKIYRGDFLNYKFIQNNFDIIFIDPPYGVYEPQKVLEVVHHNSLLSEGGVVVYEEFFKTPFHVTDNFKVTDERKYGDTYIRFMEQNI